MLSAKSFQEIPMLMLAMAPLRQVALYLKVPPSPFPAPDFLARLTLAASRRGCSRRACWSRPSCSRSRCTCWSRNPVQAHDPGLETVGEDLSELSPPPSPPYGDSSCASTVHDSPKARGTVSYKDEKDNPRPAFGDNREKEAFVTQICTE